MQSSSAFIRIGPFNGITIIELIQLTKYKRVGSLMYRLSVILIHALIFIVATIIGLGGKYNLASPEPGKTYVVWFSAIAIFNILVIVSAFVQLRVRKIWVFLISVIGLIIFFIYALPHIVLYVEDFLR